MTDRRKSDDLGEGERIAKVLARAGVGSRREVERMIADKRVKIRGKIVETPAIKIRSVEGVIVDDKPVARAEPTRVWRYYKGRGEITAANDPKGRRTVFDSLPKAMPRTITVGRLDYNTEGLLLLTNDGELARWMELPKTGMKRKYRARVFGEVDGRKLKALEEGVKIGGIQYGSIKARLERQAGRNAWVAVELWEGKNLEIRRVMEHIGLKVSRLIRTAYGPFELGALSKNAVEEVPASGIEAILRKRRGGRKGRRR